MYRVFTFFLIGIYDDKYNLSANKKLFLNFFIILFIILLDDSLVIKKLNFSFFDNPIYLKSFSHLFTVLCILLFLNALNMFDGINLQAAFYCLIFYNFSSQKYFLYIKYNFNFYINFIFNL